MEPRATGTPFFLIAVAFLVAVTAAFLITCSPAPSEEAASASHLALDPRYVRCEFAVGEEAPVTHTRHPAHYFGPHSLIKSLTAQI
jgi:hypothetical protein